MNFRYARHTSQLKNIQKFYTEILPLKLLDSFEGHSDYNGIFLGLENCDWHLEFTDSNECPNHSFDEDDALVFYLENKTKIEEYRKSLTEKNIKIFTARNSYWNNYGLLIKDPDGHGIILAYRPQS